MCAGQGPVSLMPNEILFGDGLGLLYRETSDDPSLGANHCRPICLVPVFRRVLAQPLWH